MERYTNAISDVKSLYQQNYAQHQYSQKSLSIYSDRQNIRFHMLVKDFDLDNCSILDLGCGFGDFNKFMQEFTNFGHFSRKEPFKYSYLGVDMIPEFIREAETRYGNENVHFICTDVLKFESEQKYDYVITSQTLNNRLYPETEHNYGFLHEFISIGFEKCNKAISFNFFTDKVQFKNSNTAYHSPEKILEYAYSLSKNIVFNNHYAPYECTMTIYRDDSMDPKMKLYNQFLKENEEIFDSGFYHVNTESE